ncbi:MAG: hypothetical protein N3E50_08045 [Candidatus Goldbacteria bacterium]|nr:hypothetical protein [Candidatus Goldiibacteriota bacterium]
MKKRNLLVVILFMFLTEITYSAAGVTSVFDIGLGVRSQTLGCAFTAATEDTSVIYYNPAGLNTISRIEVLASYNPLFYDTNYGYFVFGFPTLDFGTFGFSFAAFNTRNITLRDISGNPLDTITQSIIEMIAGWGGNFFYKELQIGLNLKIDFQSLSDSNDLGFGMDFGLLYLLQINQTDKVNLGLMFKNLIEPQIKLFRYNEFMPRQYILGINYIKIFNDEISGKIFLDLYAPINIDFIFKSGLEILFYDNFFFRIGYDSYNIYSLGAGVEFFQMIFIDYGFFITELGTQHRISLRSVFGESVIEGRANKEKIEAQKIEKRARMLAAEELKNMREKIDKIAGESRQKEYFKALHYTRGLENYYDGNLKMALIEFETVYQADRNYMNTQYYISLIKNILGQARDALYSEEIIKLYRAGVEKYIKEDYKGAKEEWEKILKLDPYNRLAIENLREVNSILRNIEEK